MLEVIEEGEEEKGLYDYVPEMAAEDEAVLKKLLAASAQRKVELAAAGIVEGDNDVLFLRVRLVFFLAFFFFLNFFFKKKKGPVLSKAELAAKKEADAALRAAKRDERRAERWRKNGYTSLSLEDVADESPAASPKASPSQPAQDEDIIMGTNCF